MTQNADSVSILVPTETGSVVAVEIEHVECWYVVKVSDELMHSAPQAVSAAIVMAFQNYQKGWIDAMHQEHPPAQIDRSGVVS